jgi:hypothetical protein
LTTTWGNEAFASKGSIIMKRSLLMLLLAAAAAPAFGADVGVSINIGQPGFYGRIDVGNYPAPQLVYAEPIVIQRIPVGVVRQPVYLRVPPGHAKNWSKHCGKYGACGQPVYFVQDNWYNNVYAPQYRENEAHGEGKKGKQGNGKGHKND